MSVERRLVAILSADAKGYSRLMGEDELGTVRTLTAYRAIMRDTIGRLRGRVVDSPGDNLLAEFGSVVDAITACVEIQDVLGKRNSELAEGRRLEFRMGVNVGDVMTEGDGIYGDAVNIAARLESLSDPGGLCVSGPVYDQVVAKLPLQWEPLGEQSMKNIARRVPVYRACLPHRNGTATRSAPLRPAYRPSIAVLPFREMEVCDTHRYFADGIVDDIIGALASLPDLFVISRNSTSRFNKSPVDVAAVGQDLAVRYVLSGSVRRAGDRTRISAELADTESRTVLWTDRIEGRADDLFELQDRLSEKIVTTIAPHVREAEIRRALRKRPENLDAYDFMLRGLALLYRLRRTEFDRAHEMFDRSIALDPGYAAPYALTAIWHSIQIGQGWSVHPRAAYAEASRFAEAALERDPFDTRALALSGHVRSLLFHDYEGAFALFDRALAASPNSAVAWIRSSPTYSYVGDADEAKRRGLMGLRLSPFDSHLFYAHTALGLASYTAGDFADAIVWGRKAMSQNPNFTANLRFLAASLAAEGCFAEARAVGRALLAAEPDFHVVPFCENYAYKAAARRVAFANHLKSAGLPD